MEDEGKLHARHFGHGDFKGSLGTGPLLKNELWKMLKYMLVLGETRAKCT